MCLQRKGDGADTVALLNTWIEEALGLSAVRSVDQLIPCTGDANPFMRE